MSHQPFPRIFVSAVRKSSGKTMFTLGLSAALTEQGKSVRVYKKGPDYIDPMWHGVASTRESYNLDPFLMGDEACKEAFQRRSAEVDFSIIEGNLGLHDGLDLDGRYSSAALSKLLRAPVVLVVDSTGMNRNVAAIVHGLQTFDSEVDVRGVVLNNLRSDRQKQKQVAAIERYCGIPVVGALPLMDRTAVEERHLGLVTDREVEDARAVVERLRTLVTDNVDLDAIVSIASAAPELAVVRGLAPPRKEARVTIAIARDPAFCFYYADNLDALEGAGAHLVSFNALQDSRLPPADALYLGGGFPESFLHELELNRSLREDIRTKVDAGLPTYAECGGMMYLTRSISRHGVTSEMVGALPADVQFHEKPVGYGYVELEPTGAESWLRFETTRCVRGHEFHYSELVNIGAELQYLYALKRGKGTGSDRDGILYKNVVASYTHLHASSLPEWASSFVQRAAEYRDHATT